MTQNINEPLAYLTGKYKFDRNTIRNIVSGEKYTAVLLKNGNLGVCANLGVKVDTSTAKYESINLNFHQHRIVVNAYLNALLNSTNNSLDEGDIFDVVDFNIYKKIIMVGFFKPVIQKFQEAAIPVHIFDYRKEDEFLISMKEQTKYLQEADAVILTSTSIANNTFSGIIHALNLQCEAFMLGPSSIMSGDFFRYNNIKMIFGTQFRQNDEQVLSIIANDGGTRDFSGFASKRILKNLHK